MGVNRYRLESVKNFRKFKREFQQHLRTSYDENIRAKLVIHGSLMVEIEGEVSVGDYECWHIYLREARVGAFSTMYLDEHFFMIPLILLGRPPSFLTREELELLLRLNHWETAIAPVIIEVDDQLAPGITRAVERFIEAYADDYPNEIAGRYAPKARVLKFISYTGLDQARGLNGAGR